MRKLIFITVSLVLLGGALYVMSAENPAITDSMRSTAFAFLVVGSIGGFVIYKVREGYVGTCKVASTPKFVCTVCYSQVAPKTNTPGNFALELLLWLFMILPGLLYSIWRVSSRNRICPVCNAPNPIPINSPAGQQLVSRT